MILAIFQERLTRNPPLTTADGEETILESPFEFLSLEFLSFQMLHTPNLARTRLVCAPPWPESGLPLQALSLTIDCIGPYHPTLQSS